jgi:hypothetical protein
VSLVTCHTLRFTFQTTRKPSSLFCFAVCYKKLLLLVPDGKTVFPWKSISGQSNICNEGWNTSEAPYGVQDSKSGKNNAGKTVVGYLMLRITHPFRSFFVLCFQACL